MSSKNFKQRLAEAKKSWKSNKQQVDENGFGQGFEEFEDGRYLAQLVDAEMGESQNSGRPQVTWSFKFLEGEYKGKTKKDYQGIDEQGQKFLMQRISKFGYEIPEALEEVEDLLKELIKEKPICRIRLKSKGEFQNVFLDKVLGKDEVESGDEPEGNDDPDGITDDPETPEEDQQEEAAEPEAEEDEGTEIKEGMKVTAKISGKEIQCTVIEVKEDEEKVRVKTDKGVIYSLSSERITGVIAEEEVPEEPAEEAEEEEQEEEKPTKKAAKKVVKKTSSLKKKK